MGASAKRTPRSSAWLPFASSSAATAGSATRLVTSSVVRDTPASRRCTYCTTSSWSPSSSSPEMVCSRLLNSCAWARRVSVVWRVTSSSRCSATSSVRSRSVVTDPMRRPRVAIGRVLSTMTREPTGTTRSGRGLGRVSASRSAGSRSSSATCRPTTPTGSPSRLAASSLTRVTRPCRSSPTTPSRTP